jgi:hypothetical protein
MPNRKSTKVKDLKPRAIKNASREAGSIKGGDTAVTKPTSGPRNSDIPIVKYVDKSSLIL